MAHKSTRAHDLEQGKALGVRAVSIHEPFGHEDAIALGQQEALTLDTSSLRDLAISDTGFVFDPYTGHTFTVNATGLVLLKELARGAAPGDLPSVLASKFECSTEDDPARDAVEFLAMLKDAGLVR